MSATKASRTPRLPVVLFAPHIAYLEKRIAKTGESKSTIIREALRKLMEEEETAQLKRDLTIKAILGQE